MQVKNRFELELRKKVGPIELRMSRQTVQSILGKPEFTRQESFYLRDSYNSDKLQIDYSPDTLLCKGIEVYSGSKLIYEGKNLLGLSFKELLQWLLKLDPKLHIDLNLDTYISHKFKFAVKPRLENHSNTEVIDSIVIFTKDYWYILEPRETSIEDDIESDLSLEDLFKEMGLEDSIYMFSDSDAID
jgi:hypothetical protein